MSPITAREAHAAAVAAVWGSAFWGLGRGALYVLAALLDALAPGLVVPAERAQVYEVTVQLVGAMWPVGLLVGAVSALAVYGVRPSVWRTPPAWLPRAVAAYGLVQFATGVLLFMGDPLSPGWYAGVLSGTAGIVASVVLRTTCATADADRGRDLWTAPVR